ncbi:GntR family transcriptional regulator [Alkalicaulis satelles]|uniref:GntR family transcriptional regulator n=1 Tax=Alkalicaulis satelles TaxID=2609175 RepID=A0A5M6ZFH0_9PROT|nr:GntR family transcriptional regulator [Alkalicaulis satelles]KAA5803512.1 GntR family transcriptional regulator [Alkalicaulis satelles]
MTTSSARGSDAAPRLAPDLIDESLPTPLYHQIFLVLRDRIREGGYPAGTILPGEQELTRLFNVSRITVKRAMNELAAHGFVTRHRGRGTVVTHNAGAPVVEGRFDTLFDALKRMGLETQVQLLEASHLRADEELALEMALEPGHRVQRAVRLRSLEGDTFSYLITHVPGEIAARYSEDDLKTQPMQELLRRAGAEAVEADQTITATAAEPHIAAALRISPGAPLLKIKRIMRGRDGRAVQHIIAYYRPERFRYHMRLVRKDAAGEGWSEAELA